MRLSIIIAGLFLFLSSSISLRAQDFCKTDPSFSKVLVDTSYLTAMEVTFMPGKKTNMHTHPAHWVYALDAGKLNVTYADGTSETFEVKTGDSMFGAPEKPHTTTNMGNKPLRMLLVELKEHPYMAEKMKK